MSLVATLPAVPVKARKKAGASAADQRLQQQLTEAVDGMRTMLLHAARSEKLSTIMITSATGGEGKTSLATQLAASLARAWRKTLLIDGDVRNPGAHKIFDLPQEPGFCELLRGEVSLADAVRPTSLSRLWVMPAGHWDSHAVEALAQDNVHELFVQLKEQYDFVIVDSCPVLPVADGLLLAQHMDGVLLAVLRDVSRTPAVYAANQRLQNLGIRILGAVVIGDADATAYPA
jgi:capsular exopolysaccharide synthesis family protein